MSFIPEPYTWAQPVVIAAIVVFVVSYIGNMLTMYSKLVNALVTAIVFALIFGAVTYFGYGGVNMSVSSTPAANAPAEKAKQR